MFSSLVFVFPLDFSVVVRGRNVVGNGMLVRDGLWDRQELWIYRSFGQRARMVKMVFCCSAWWKNE